MNTVDNDLVEMWLKKRISEEEFLKIIEELISGDKDCLIRDLKEGFKNKDSKRIEFLILAISIIDEKLSCFCLNDYLDILNNLLVENWHNKHEDLVYLLERIHDSKSIDFLIKAMNLDLDYLSWDDNYSFERKIIHAIYHIGGKKAHEYLDYLCSSSNQIIKETAMKQLKKSDRMHVEFEIIKALYNDKTIRVYQAFNKEIAAETVAKGTFGERFNMNRTTWIKPSFLWVMYRSGWATKACQERVLAIDIRKEGFDYLVQNSIYTSFSKEKYESYEKWHKAFLESDVLCQWDPDRDYFGNSLRDRTIQIGIRGSMLQSYIKEMIVSINDITEEVHLMKHELDNKKNITEKLPKESLYRIDY